MSASTLLQHTINQFANASIITTPFPHIVVSDVFPKDYYREILDNVPPIECAIQLRATAGGNPNRVITNVEVLDSLFWREFAGQFGGRFFANIILMRFGQRLEDENIVTTDVVQDRVGYSIGPHTDVKRKKMTILFYLPRDNQLRDFGTSICKTTDESLIDTDHHHSWDSFVESHVVVFHPNSALAFCRTEDSFHAVKTVSRDVIRNTVAVTVRHRPKP